MGTVTIVNMYLVIGDDRVHRSTAEHLASLFACFHLISSSLAVSISSTSRVGQSPSSRQIRSHALPVGWAHHLLEHTPDSVRLRLAFAVLKIPDAAH